MKNKKFSITKLLNADSNILKIGFDKNYQGEELQFENIIRKNSKVPIENYETTRLLDNIISHNPSMKKQTFINSTSLSHYAQIILEKLAVHFI